MRARLAAQARRLHQLWGGRIMRPETLHLTLVFIGNVAHNLLPNRLGVPHGVDIPAFATVFDRADCWRHNRIGFLTATSPPQALFDLVQALEGSLIQAGIDFDRRPYQPHITLLRNVTCGSRTLAGDEAAADFQPITWDAREIVLLGSSASPVGVVYRPLATYPLS